MPRCCHYVDDPPPEEEREEGEEETEESLEDWAKNFKPPKITKTIVTDDEKCPEVEGKTCISSYRVPKAEDCSDMNLNLAALPELPPCDEGRLVGMRAVSECRLDTWWVVSRKLWLCPDGSIREAEDYSYDTGQPCTRPQPAVGEVLKSMSGE